MYIIVGNYIKMFIILIKIIFLIKSTYRSVLKFKQRHVTATETGSTGRAVRTKEGWEIPSELAFVICYTRAKQKSCSLCKKILKKIN